MSPLLMYALADRPEASLPTQPGLGGEPLLAIAYRDIAVVASPVAATRVQATEADLWAYEAVVEALMEDRAVLPWRFGSVLSDEEAARALLAAHYADFWANLALVRRRVELGLCVLWDPGELATPPVLQPERRAGGNGEADSGRAYLMAKLERELVCRERQKEGAGLVQVLHGPLAMIAARSQCKTLPTPGMLMTGVYLVDLDAVAGFKRQVDALKSAHFDLEFLCTGPWPPYSFITASTGAPAMEGMFDGTR